MTTVQLPAGLFGTRSRLPVEGSMYNSDDDRSHMLDQREQRIPTRGLQHDDAHGRAFHESHSFHGPVQLPGRHSPPPAVDQRDYTFPIAGAHAVLPDDRDAIYRGEENPSRYPPPRRYYDSYRVEPPRPPSNTYGSSLQPHEDILHPLVNGSRPYDDNYGANNQPPLYPPNQPPQRMIYNDDPVPQYPFRHRYPSPDWNPLPRRERIMMDHYDGNGPLDSFLFKFNSCALHNRWTHDDKAAHLRAALTGPAIQIMIDDQDMRLTFDQMVDRLQQRFGNKGQTAKHQSLLRSRRRGKGESLPELYHDIARLVHLAFPGPPNSVTDVLAIDAFLAALNNPDFEIKIREREPANLDAAFQVAVRLEGYAAAAQRGEGHGDRRAIRSVSTDALDSCPDGWRKDFNQIATNLMSEAHHRTAALFNDLRSELQLDRPDKPKSVRGSNVDSSSKPSPPESSIADPSLKSQLANVQAQLEKQKAAAAEEHARDQAKLRDLEMQLKAMSSPKASIPSLLDVSTGRPVGHPSKVTCFRCGSPGHVSTNCPNWSTLSCTACGRQGHVAEVCRSTTTNNNHQEGLTCFHCNERGHVKRRCPKLNHTSVNMLSTLRHSRSHLRSQEKEDLVYIEGFLNGTKRKCLLDSGCQQSIIPSSHVRPKQLRPTDAEVFAANGSKIPLRGCASLMLSISGNSYLVQALVSDHVTEAMLGIDWLILHGVVWPFGSQCIIVDGVSVPLVRSLVTSDVGRVYVERRVQVPPWSDMACWQPKMLVIELKDTQEAIQLYSPDKNVFECPFKDCAYHSPRWENVSRHARKVHWRELVVQGRHPHKILVAMRMSPQAIEAGVNEMAYQELGGGAPMFKVVKVEPDEVESDDPNPNDDSLQMVSIAPPSVTKSTTLSSTSLLPSMSMLPSTSTASFSSKRPLTGVHTSKPSVSSTRAERTTRTPQDFPTPSGPSGSY